MRRSLAVAVLLSLSGAALVWFVTAWSTAVLDSSSMEPWASPGDLLVHRVVPADTIVTQDVITVRTPDRGLVTHRVVALDEADVGRIALLRGDASRFPDREPVTLRGDVDRVVLVVPRVGGMVRVGGPWLLGGALLILGGAVVLGLAQRHAPEPFPATPTAAGPVVDPRIEALVATCEQLEEDGLADAVLADLVRVRTAAILALPAAERSGAVLSTDDGARFYVLAVADADQAMLGLVPVASTRRQEASAAIDAWWAAIEHDVPPGVVDAIADWTG